MNFVTITQIQTFRDEVIRPTFLDLKAKLDIPGKLIVLINHPDTGSEAIDDVLRQMHPEKCYLTHLLDSSLLERSTMTAQSWIGDSLYIEILQSPETLSCCLGRYCLSIEFSFGSFGQIQVASIVGHTSPGTPHLKIEHQLFEQEHLPLDIQSIQGADLSLRFIESFSKFETQFLDSDIDPDVAVLESPESDIHIAVPKYLPETELLNSDISLDVASPEPAAPVTSLDSLDTSASNFAAVTPVEANPEEDLPPKPAAPEPFIQTQDLHQLATQLAQDLSPPGFSLHSKLNPNLSSPAQIIPILDRYDRTIDLRLEYSSSVQESDLREYLHCLGQYQTLKSLAHQHTFIEQQINVWYQQNGNPSPGAIAPCLNQQIMDLGDTFDQRIRMLSDRQLQSTTAHTLEVETTTFRTQQQQQQTLLNQIDQDPILGYLDPSLLNENTGSSPSFTEPDQSIDILAQHLNQSNGKRSLTLVTSCQNPKFKTYCQRRSTQSILRLIIEYTITQKLYPQRPVFIGAAPKAVFPRLEQLWSDSDPSPLRQIWRVFPMNRADAPQWLILAATTDTQPLQTLTLENGKIAQEGTDDYLQRSLHLMAQSDDDYTQTLSHLVTEASEQKRIKYLHLHQTQNLQTQEPRDLLQMQFQLVR
jgi:hypothetical protein